MFIPRRGSAQSTGIFFALIAAVLIAIFFLGGIASKIMAILTRSAAQPTLAVPTPPIVEPKPPEIVAPVESPPIEPTSIDVPKPKDHFQLNLSSAFNETIGANWKRENHDDDGIPADGRVPVPSVVPRAYLLFAQPDAPNAIQLQKGTPVTIAIPPNQRGKYGRLAVLHGSPKGNVTVLARLHYDTGDEVTDELRVQDWSRRDEAKETFVHKSMIAGRVQLFAQVVKLDTTRTLESVTLESEGTADIFAATIILSANRPFDGNK